MVSNASVLTYNYTVMQLKSVFQRIDIPCFTADQRGEKLERMTLNLRFILFFAVTVALAGSTQALAAALQLPFLPAANSPTYEGFVRIVNETKTSENVSVFETDDAGNITGQAFFSVLGFGAKAFKISDLESGNSAKGLEGSIGAGTGFWRLQFNSPSAIKTFGYFRNPTTGFLNPIHDSARPAYNGSRQHISSVNPGRNVNQISVIRLINNSGTRSATASLRGRDEAGNQSKIIEMVIPALNAV